MIYNLKFKEQDFQRVLFYSDMHYKHNPNWSVPLWKLRGFNSVFEHDAAQIENWNKKVTSTDIVFFLGDLVVGAGNKGEEAFESLFQLLNYKELYVMPGNHYSGFKQILDGHTDQTDDSIIVDKYYRTQVYRSDNKKVYFIPNYYEIYVNSQPIVLSHYPVLSWNGMAHGAWMLHGHCHGSLHKTDWIEEKFYKGKVMDIGPESTGSTPISFNELKEIFKNREDLEIDHHRRDTSSPFAER